MDTMCAFAAQLPVSMKFFISIIFIEAVMLGAILLECRGGKKTKS